MCIRDSYDRLMHPLFAKARTSRRPKLSVLNYYFEVVYVATEFSIPIEHLDTRVTRKPADGGA